MGQAQCHIASYPFACAKSIIIYKIEEIWFLIHLIIFLSHKILKHHKFMLLFYELYIYIYN